MFSGAAPAAAAVVFRRVLMEEDSISMPHYDVVSRLGSDIHISGWAVVIFHKYFCERQYMLVPKDPVNM
jgi:hypothetical protein